MVAGLCRREVSRSHLGRGFPATGDIAWGMTEHLVPTINFFTVPTPQERRRISENAGHSETLSFF